MTYLEERTARELDRAVTDARTPAEREAQKAIRDAYRRVMVKRGLLQPEERDAPRGDTA